MEHEIFVRFQIGLSEEADGSVEFDEQEFLNGLRDTALFHYSNVISVVVRRIYVQSYADAKSAFRTTRKAWPSE